MPISLYSTFIIINQKLDEERKKILDTYFYEDYFRIMAYIILLHSSLECFLREAFKKHTGNMKEGAVKNLFDGKATQFSMEKDFKLFCDFFLPDRHLEFSKLEIIIKKRNRYCHRTFKDGDYILKKEPLSKEELDDYLEYSKKIMRDILYSTDQSLN